MATDSDFLEELSKSNHKFTRDVYQILAKGEKNVIFSPISMQVALLMAWSGARGKTEEEMKKCLNLRKGKDEILQGIRILMEKLKIPNLKIASQFFIGQQYNLNSTYTSLVKEYLKCSCETVDFLGSPEEAASTINSWASEETENQIPNIIDAGTLDKHTVSVLVNALHFEDEWRFKFVENHTNGDLFFSSIENFYIVSMMYMMGQFNYFESELYRVIALPYENEDLRLLILLPKEIGGLCEIEEKLEEIDFRKIISNKRVESIHFKLPIFKMEQQIDGKKVLQKLGMKNMFDQEAADFSEIYHNPYDDTDNLYVNDVYHKTVFGINENGTKGATVTRRSLLGGGFVEGEFKVDHPFIFMLIHQSTILYMGKKSTF